MLNGPLKCRKFKDRDKLWPISDCVVCATFKFRTFLRIRPMMLLRTVGGYGPGFALDFVNIDLYILNVISHFLWVFFCDRLLLCYPHF